MGSTRDCNSFSISRGDALIKWGWWQGRRAAPPTIIKEVTWASQRDTPTFLQIMFEIIGATPPRMRFYPIDMNRAAKGADGREGINPGGMGNGRRKLGYSVRGSVMVLVSGLIEILSNLT